MTQESLFDELATDIPVPQPLGEPVAEMLTREEWLKVYEHRADLTQQICNERDAWNLKRGM